jgi:hypothetical protein
MFSCPTEANARQQLLEHLGFHAGVIEKAALEFNEDIVKGVGTMSVEENSTAPMVSARTRIVVQRKNAKTNDVYHVLHFRQRRQKMP